MKTLPCAILVLVSACSGSTAPAAVAPPSEHREVAAVAVPSVAVTGRGLFCTFGGVGIVPAPLPVGFETSFVTMAFELDNPGPPVAGVSVAAASIHDPAGPRAAAMRRLDHFVVLSPEPRPDPTWGSFAIYLNPAGSPFAGTLPTGTTRLRIRYSADSPSYPGTCRVELSGLGAAPLVLERELDGALPSS